MNKKKRTLKNSLSRSVCEGGVTWIAKTSSDQNQTKKICAILRNISLSKKAKEKERGKILKAY